MIDEKLRELLEFAKTTDLQELVWEKNGSKISFRRSNVKPAHPPAGSPAAEAEVEEEPVVHYIRSTMVGTFFRGDAHDRPPLVVEGTQVNSGEPVASIEAMKIRKDVVTPLTCRIIKSLVVDGHSVEYGQPLFEVELTNGANGDV
jgi:acetyl-CoA carboxylase biotin carboxyl carrier protein